MGERGPGRAEFSQDAIGRGGAAVTLAAARDDPDAPIHLRTAELRSSDDPGSLIRQSQHTAGMIAHPYPPRDTRSDSSPTVEEQQQARLAKQLPQPLVHFVAASRSSVLGRHRGGRRAFWNWSPLVSFTP